MRTFKQLHCVKQVLFLFLFFCGSFTLAQTHEPSLKKELWAILNKELMRAKTPGGVLLVRTPSLGMVQVAAGYANEAKKIPMQVTDTFRLESITKTFLATLILKLNEAGKIELKKPMYEYLPADIAVDKIPNGRTATVENLLNMQSGIPEYWDSTKYNARFAEKKNTPWGAKEVLEVVYDVPADFSPGKKYKYSNTNYILLELIVNNITKRTLAEALRQYIIDPLKLNNTYIEVSEKRTGGFDGLTARGYEKDNKNKKDVTEIQDSLGLGDAGVVSTAEDVATFVEALLVKKTLLSETALAKMLTFNEEEYGLGIYREHKKTIYTHNGTGAGFHGQYYYIPRLQAILVVLVNDENDKTNLLERTLKKVEKVLAKSYPAHGNTSFKW